MDKGDSDVHGKTRWQGQVQGLGRAAEALPLTTLVAAIAGTFLFSERSEEHTSELQSLMRISYAVFCLKKKTNNQQMITQPIATQKVSNSHVPRIKYETT